MSVAIVDYGSGNLHSAHKAFERAAREAGLNRVVKVTSDPDDVARAAHIVLPGVGAFADCRRGLDAVPGMVEALEDAVRRRGRPFLGICVGMQLMADRGFEHGETAGLGWIKGSVVALDPSPAADGAPLHPMQEAFREHHGLQCGFCTPGMIMTAVDMVHRKGHDLSEHTIREELEGNLCRCTGYQNIVQSIAAGAKAMAGSDLA